MKNYYEILEIPRDALTTDINKAYRRLALRYHPDKRTSTLISTEEKTEKNFQDILEAYQTLSDPYQKEKYDRRLRAETEGEIRTISGLITHHEPSLGQKYRTIHANLTQNQNLNPQEKAPLPSTLNSRAFSSRPETGFSAPMESNLDLVPLPFSPSSAFKLYIGYLNNHPTSPPVPHLKSWFEHAIAQEQQNQNDLLNLKLYEGFLELISNEKPVYTSIKKIVHYARYQNPYNRLAAVENLALLFQHRTFRTLFRQGFEVEWTQPINLDISSLFSSEFDETLKNDIEETRPLYLHTLYDAEQSLKMKYLEVQNTDCQAEAWRSLAFECLDYVHIVNSNTLIAINFILHACFFLKQSIQVEENIHLQFADEKLIILLAAFAANMGQRDKPSVDFYAHHHSLHLISTLKFKHSELSMVSLCLRRHLYILIDFFPCMTEMHSNLNLLKQEVSQLDYLRQYMTTLKQWLDYNKTSLPEEEKLLTLKEVDILYHLYEAHINLWAKKPSDDTNNEERFDPEEEQLLRTQLMEASLAEKTASFVDISKNIHSDWNMVNRDEFGWLKPFAPLPFMAGLKIYQSIEGLEYSDTGEIQFVFKAWDEQDPINKRAFSSLDFQHMLQNNLYQISFSLDQKDSQYPYHPFQTMAYSPASLEGSEYLFTLLDTDYLLKFFTTGQEVQGQYPYAMRPVQAILDALPLQLQNIISEYRHSKKNGKVNRFWIEADAIPVLEETHGVSKKRFTFGNIRMSLKTHPMVYDKEGNLEDLEATQEGWHVYLLDDIRAFEAETIGKDFQFRAIIIIRNSDRIYFFEEQKLSIFPSRIPLSTALQEELLVQNFNPQGLILKGKKPYQDNDHFLYQLTTYICDTIKKPTHFSPERIFAEKFTLFYDQFAEAIPSFYRLKELSRATSIINQLNLIYQTHADSLSKHQQKLENHQQTFTEKKEECAVFYQGIQADYASQIKILTEDLQQKRNIIGEVTHTSSSKEFLAFCRQYSLDPNDDLLLAQHNAMGRRKRLSYQQEIATCYQDVLNFLGAEDFNSRVELFFKGEVQPLAEGIASHKLHNTIAIWQKKLEAKFSGYATTKDIEEALKGNAIPLAESLTKHAISQSCSIPDIALEASIEKQSAFLQRFKEIGIGITIQREDEARLNWVPAVCHHSVGEKKASFVYGGVRIAPTMICKLEAFRHSYQLQMPSESAFSGNLDRIRARDFIQGLKSELSAIPNSYKADTFEVESMIRDLERKLWSFPNREREMCVRHSSLSDFGFRPNPSSHVFLTHTLTEGIVGKAEYHLFKSTTPQQSAAVELEAKKEAPNNSKGFFSPLALFRASKRLEGLRTTFSEHVKKVGEFSFVDKALMHKSPTQLQTHFLNAYEKLRTEQANEIKKAQEAKIQAEREEKARKDIENQMLKAKDMPEKGHSCPKFISDAYSHLGSYAPQVEHLGSLVEPVFEKYGIIDWYKEMLPCLAPGDTPLPIPNISHDKLGFMRASGACFKEFSHYDEYKPIYTYNAPLYRDDFDFSPITNIFDEFDDDFSYEKIRQSSCEANNVSIGEGICAGVVTSMVLEEVNDRPFFSKETCQKSKIYQIEHETFSSLFAPSPHMRTANILRRNGYDVESSNFFDYKNMRTLAHLHLCQEDAKRDGKRHAIYIAKAPIFAQVGHATFFSAKRNQQGQIVCTGMDPNRAIMHGYGIKGCEKVKNFLSSHIQEQTGDLDETTLLKAMKLGKD